MSDYPEHDKMDRVKVRSQVIGEFLDWMLNDTGIILAVVGSESDFLTPTSESFEQLLARYFEIDLRVIETEKRAMLAALQILNAQPTQPIRSGPPGDPRADALNDGFGD